MKVHLWSFGAPSDAWVSTGENIYIRRIEKYLPFEFKTIQASKSNQVNTVLKAEAKWIGTQLENISTRLILLDEKGPQFPSVQFSKKLESWRQGTHKRLVFLIGSAYGFAPEVNNFAHELLSLSSMTLPHQLCRLVFLEQLYRACTILKGESYHHQ